MNKICKLWQQGDWAQKSGSWGLIWGFGVMTECYEDKEKLIWNQKLSKLQSKVQNYIQKDTKA